MGRRISTYANDVVVDGNDKWIGSDVSNRDRTMNFTPDNLSLYYNSNGYGTPSRHGIVFTYKPFPTTDIKGLFNLRSNIGSTTTNPLPLNNTLTEVLVSNLDNNRTNIRPLLDYLAGKDIKISTPQVGPNDNYAVYTVGTVSDYDGEDDYAVVQLTYVDGPDDARLTSMQTAVISPLSGTGSGGSGTFDLSTHSVEDLRDVTSAGSGRIITAAERTAIGTNTTAQEANALKLSNITDRANRVTFSSTGAPDATLAQSVTVTTITGDTTYRFAAGGSTTENNINNFVEFDESLMDLALVGDVAVNATSSVQPNPGWSQTISNVSISGTVPTDVSAVAATDNNGVRVFSVAPVDERLSFTVQYDISAELLVDTTLTRNFTAQTFNVTINEPVYVHYQGSEPGSRLPLADLTRLDTVVDGRTTSNHFLLDFENRQNQPWAIIAIPNSAFRSGDSGITLGGGGFLTSDAELTTGSTVSGYRQYKVNWDQNVRIYLGSNPYDVTTGAPVPGPAGAAGEGAYPVFASNVAGEDQSLTPGTNEFIAFYETAVQPVAADLPIASLNGTFVRFAAAGGGIQPHEDHANITLSGTADKEATATGAARVFNVQVGVNTGFTAQIVGVDVPTGWSVGTIPDSTNNTVAITPPTGVTAINGNVTFRVRTIHTTDNTEEITPVSRTLHLYLPWFFNNHSTLVRGTWQVLPTTGDQMRFDGDETVQFINSTVGGSATKVTEYAVFFFPNLTGRDYRFRLAGFDFTADDVQVGSNPFTNYTRFVFDLKRDTVIEITTI